MNNGEIKNCTFYENAGIIDGASIVMYDSNNIWIDSIETDNCYS